MLFGAGSVLAADTGSITGKVTLKGGQAAAAERKAIDMAAVKECADMHKEKKAGYETEVVSKEGGIRYVMVWIKDGLGEKKFTAPAEPVELDQEGCVYKPHAFGMMAGQKLLIKNTDPTLHNVHALPKKNEEFNNPQPAKGAPIEKTFARTEEPFLVKCDVHPWMGAYCGVFDHPFFAVTDKDGNFTIKDVPPGEYTIKIWHEVYPPKEVKVSVKTGDTAKADAELEPKK
jgi:plastocyanin